MKRGIRCILGLLIATSLTVPLYAKGTTIKLVVTAPTLSEPLEVTKPAALVSAWSDDFIGAITEEPDKTLTRYRVAFHVQPPRTTEIRVMYVVHYVLDPHSGEGFVYLPGRGEKEYGLNVSTILRGGHDGKWHRAPDPWNRALRTAIAGALGGE